MFEEIGFDRPHFLWLLLLLPVIWILSFNSLAGLGRSRRVFAIAFRSLVYAALVFALAEIHWRDLTNRLTVLYLLDQSESIPREQREAMMTYVAKSVDEHRKSNRGIGTGDLAGVIVFGTNADFEASPYEGSLPIVARSELKIATEGTNIEAALRLAKAGFPEDTARRVVIVTDGNENIGDVLTAANSFVRDGIGIDVVPIKLDRRNDVAVDKLMVPSDVRKDQPFEARVVLTNENLITEDNPDGKVSGELILKQRIGGREELIAQQRVMLNPGKNVIGFQHELNHADMITLDASFLPDDPSQDAVSKNNSAGAFVHVRGKGRVLLIEDVEFPGEFFQLIDRLKTLAIEVDVMQTDQLFTSAAELLQYDSVILANVPRSSESGMTAVGFSDQQIQILVNNCRELGCGIVMIGGDRSFGVGGWTNSELEKAMPVDFQIKNDKVSAVGALAMVMHASEMAQGNYWQMKVGQEAVNCLGPMDFCGVVEWDHMAGRSRWLWQLPTGMARISENKRRMLNLINRMTPGDMPDFDSSMELALLGLKNCPASMKHMIIISDGDPTPPRPALLRRYVDEKILISTVAIGTHGPANSALLRDIAKQTGGKYYEVADGRALPKIYQREARRVAKPVIKESKAGMQAIPNSMSSRHEILQGVDANALPPFYGYVMTTVKQNPLVEQLLIASEPADNTENSTLLAAWRYELGRTVVFTSDAGKNWTSNWYNSEYYDKLFTQMVRYSMRPVTENANFSLSTDVRDNKGRVVVTVIDESDEFINFLNLAARGLPPASADGTERGGFDLNFSQTGPGRYEAEFDANDPGNYLITIMPGEGYERLTTGISVPYSSEYSDRETNFPLLQNLSALTATGSTDSGMISEPFAGRDDLSAVLALNPFRPTLRHTSAIQSMWPWMLVLGAWVFLADVFIRRVAVGTGWITGLMAFVRRLRGQPDNEALASNLDRLRSKKSEISKRLEARQAETRFEPKADSGGSSGKEQLTRILESEQDREREPPPPRPVQETNRTDEQPHTSRLLDAKRKARRDPPAS